jgi:hypothetical protein
MKKETLGTIRDGARVVTGCALVALEFMAIAFICGLLVRCFMWGIGLF